MLAGIATYLYGLVFLLIIAVSSSLYAVEISISCSDNMMFGQMIPTGISGTVSISTLGIRTSVGVVVIPASPCSKAIFQVNGDSNASYFINLSSSVELSGAGDKMTLDSFVSAPSGTGILNEVGSQTINLGATLHVGPNQPPGSYTGIFDVIVSYN
jgi:hypothetical protein